MCCFSFMESGLKTHVEQCIFENNFFYIKKKSYVPLWHNGIMNILYFIPHSFYLSSQIALTG